jgi:hypothetical protein
MEERDNFTSLENRGICLLHRGAIGFIVRARCGVWYRP